MKFAKVAIAVIAFAAAYKAVDVLLLGKPADPKKAIAEWTEAIKSQLPKPVNESTSLTDIRSEWYEGGIHGGDDKYWQESYKSSVDPNEDSLNREQEAITASICKSEVHKKVMALGITIQARVSIPNSYYSKDFAVSKTLCQAKQF
jgi:hypothetical protein